jgi:hypothetical protein
MLKFLVIKNSYSGSGSGLEINLKCWIRINESGSETLVSRDGKLSIFIN